MRWLWSTRWGKGREDNTPTHHYTQQQAPENAHFWFEETFTARGRNLGGKKVIYWGNYGRNTCNRFKS